MRDASAVWREDTNKAGVTQRMIALMRQQGDDDCTNLERIDSSLHLAERHAPLILNEEALDANPDVICTPGGTLELSSGELRPSVPQDYHTRCTLVAPSTLDDCPRWLQHLEWALQGDQEVIGYLQRWSGYLLTGHTRQQSFLLVFGSGRNGKDVVFDTIREVMGTYARAAPEGLFTSREGETNECAVGAVCGYRYVYQGELPAGHRLNEHTVKLLTGCRALSARHLYGRPFDYRPVLKPVMVCNRKPLIVGTDDGIWDRLCPIPFRNYIPEEQRDTGLIDYLLNQEASGIMAWMMMGAINYYAMGLGKPESIKAERAEYRTDMDLLGAIIADCFEPDETARLDNPAMYQAVVDWWGLNMDKKDLWSHRKVTRALKDRGWVQKMGTDGVTRYWKGWRIK